MTWDWCRDDNLAVNQRSGEFICPLAGPLQAGSFPVLLTLRLPARAFTAKVQALYEALVPGPRHLGPYPALLAHPYTLALVQLALLGGPSRAVWRVWVRLMVRSDGALPICGRRAERKSQLCQAGKDRHA